MEKRILHVRMPDAHLYDVIDNLTGERIPLVQSANEETGVITMFLKDAEGNYIESYNPKTQEIDLVVFNFIPIKGFTLRKKEDI